jgi:hypothetical protein
MESGEFSEVSVRFRPQDDPDTMRARMLDCSELSMEEAARSADLHASRAAARVLESASAWRDWGATHHQLIGSVVAERGTAHQVRAVRRMALSVIHRKAPFEYLRDHAVRGGARRRFFHSIYGTHDYARAVVLEHRHYLNAMCSYLCVDRFCGPGSLQRIRSYERRYTSYWTLQAKVREREAQGSHMAAEVDAEVLRVLRADVRQARELLLESRVSAADLYTIEELRRPTGDTVRMKRLPE